MAGLDQAIPLFDVVGKYSSTPGQAVVDEGLWSKAPIVTRPLRKFAGHTNWSSL